ncbi:MAG: adaptor protein MecA [Ruminococcus sp.]
MVTGDNMTIEQIDSSKVLIVLGDKDMRDFALEYGTMSFDDPHSRKILGSILTLACTKTGISTKGKRMLVEALPHPDGCLILLTLEVIRKPRVYKIKRKKRAVCAVFENVEELIKVSAVLKNNKSVPENSLYFYDEKYCLIIESFHIPCSVMRVLREFSVNIFQSKISVARIKENGRLILESKAHCLIGQYFN